MRFTGGLTNGRAATRMVAVAAGVVLGLSVTACGGDSPQPTTLDTPTAKPTPSKSATPTPTPSDSPAKPGRIETFGPTPTGPDAAAVKGFVTQYVGAVNKAIENGNVSKLRQMYTSGCLDCVQLVASIRSTYSGGGKFVGGLYTQNHVEVFSESGGTYMVRVRSLSTAWKQYNSAGSVINQGPAERVTYTYGVRKISGNWQLTAGGKSQ
ncbi:hypothetical protein SAMN05421678_10965 [Actinopolymorpha cephalotaxi]|uniref:Lipoprotein n=1 Tax=Actinopolymorpha cephalotaxi TaxID=504797 RepID=A0A1I2V8R5_9ACTN|nr:hypothetical protein [Actinopolymorpha cephalotaxi]NYH84782.1 hypothetical protein [Actinopolymorpha cephalotaxi]SFG85510.1 hypothetical protein SAMN05421678_10965 [Actinopolymorpha cephalotaxi]